jgi:RNA polymerase sigma factor (sigma-70 family)
VSEDLPFPVDFSFAQRCLEGDDTAIIKLRKRYGPPVRAFLCKSGGSETDAGDVTEWLWADCLAKRPNRPPRLATYSGKAALKTWLSTLALNRLIALRRAREFREKHEQGGLDFDRIPETFPTEGPSAGSDAPLVELMREAVEAGFRECPPEDFVLLQLAHMDRLHLTELAHMFKCSKSKIDRDLKRAGKSVAEATMRFIRNRDPWLDLKWGDFMNLCRVASPACFGED